MVLGAAGWRQTGLPKGLSQVEVAALLAECDPERLAGVAAVLVRVSDGQSVGATETGADGAFVLPVTAAGSYRVLLADPSETWPSVFVGGTTATDFAVSAGTVAVGTIDISTGEPHVSPPVLGTTARVSLGVGGAEISDGDAQDPAISADGTVVAFASHASDVVVGDANHTDDVFVHDRATGVTSRVSVASDGTEADLWSLDPALSADGRFVAFWSGASNLVAGDTNGSFDVFVHDRSTGVTSRASVASGGAQADGYSARPAISADGRFVTFDSGAPNLVAGDTNGATDVFVHDRATGVTSRVSVASDGAQADGGGFNPTISADGRHIAFGSHSTDLVPGDTSGAGDVFVHDRSTGATTRVSVASGGIQAGGSYVWAPDISADGRFVTFVSDSTDLVPGDTNRTRDAFVHDRSTGVTTRVSVASDGTETDGLSFVSVISGDGRFVAFGSYAANLVPDDTNDTSDVFLHDRSTGTTTRVSVASDGTQGDEIIEWDLGISVDGRQVVFATYASTLVPDDTNFSVDVFLHERPAARPASRLGCPARPGEGSALARPPEVHEDDVVPGGFGVGGVELGHRRLQHLPLVLQVGAEAGVVGLADLRSQLGEIGPQRLLERGGLLLGECSIHGAPPRVTTRRTLPRPIGGQGRFSGRTTPR